MISGGAVTRLGRANALVVGVLVALSGMFVGLHVNGYTMLSPVDELQHIDYLDRAPEHPQPDDQVGQYALHQQLCRSLDAPGFGPPQCRSGRLDPSVFQERGYNTASIYTPIYYTVTKVVASGVDILTPADDLVTTGRLAGGFWLALGLVLVFAAGRMRGIDRGPLAAISVMLVSAPALLYPSATIAPDATALAVGGGLMLALTWWEQHQSTKRAALLVGLAVTAVLVKMTYLCVVALVCIYLLIRWLRGRTTGGTATPRALPVALVTGVASLAATFAWTAYVAALPQIATEELPHMATRFKVASFPWGGLGDGLFVLAQPLSNPWVLVGVPQLSIIACTIGSLVLTSGTVAAAVFGVGAERERDLARATLISAVVSSVLLVTVSYVTSGSYIPLPTRYGMALLAPLAISAAACARTRTATAILWGVAATTVLLTTWRLVALNA